MWWWQVLELRVSGGQMHVIRRMPGGTPLLRRPPMRIPKPLSRTDPGGLADDIQRDALFGRPRAPRRAYACPGYP